MRPVARNRRLEPTRRQRRDQVRAKRPESGRRTVVAHGEHDTDDEPHRPEHPDARQVFPEPVGEPVRDEPPLGMPVPVEEDEARQGDVVVTVTVVRAAGVSGSGVSVRT